MFIAFIYALSARAFASTKGLQSMVSTKSRFAGKEHALLELPQTKKINDNQRKNSKGRTCCSVGTVHSTLTW